MQRFEARQAIIEAAQGQLRPFQMLRLRSGLLMRPFAAQNAIDLVVLNCQAAGLVSEDGEVTEENNRELILEIIRMLLPLILKIFGL